MNLAAANQPVVNPLTPDSSERHLTCTTRAEVSQEVAIATRSLSFAYPGSLPVLQNLSLRIDTGQRVGIIGHNGCGKTTLFMLLCGLLTPTQGDIVLCGQPVIPGEFRPETGLLFQDPDDQLFSPSVREDIAFGPQNMGVAPEAIAQRVQEVLALTGTEALADRLPHHLSGGEKQMVAIAGLLAMQPKIMLYDEPTASLDLRTRRRLIGFLQQSSETLLISSHDLEFVLEVCDRTLLIDQGRIIADGDPVRIMGDRAIMEAHGLEKPHSLIPHIAPHHQRAEKRMATNKSTVSKSTASKPAINPPHNPVPSSKQPSPRGPIKNR